MLCQSSIHPILSCSTAVFKPHFAMAMIPRFWDRPQPITDEEQFVRLERTVEPQSLNLLLYMTNGTTAILHPLLQGQMNVSFVPALTAG